MKISITWSEPIQMTYSKSELEHKVDLQKIPRKAGVYFFARKHGARFMPILIGETEANIQGRIKGHLNSVSDIKKSWAEIRASKSRRMGNALFSMHTPNQSEAQTRKMSSIY